MEKKRKKGKLSTSKKRRKSKGMTNTSINHDSVMLSGKGDMDFEGDADGKDSDDDVDLFEEKRYEKSKAKNWTMHKNGQPGREIHPIPFTGPAEFFRPNISDNKLKTMFDEHGGIRFSIFFLSGCYQRLMACLFMNFCWQGFATFCCSASKLKGGHHCTIVLPTGKLFLLTMSHAFLDANWRRV